ncbi:MAG: homocysteine S-methyltransferase family protein [Pseudomonadales bacterium]
MNKAANRIVLLDGGMGQELLRRSGREPTALWSAQVMMDEPGIVRDLHADYIRAGSRVITLNAYSATPERLQRDGVGDQFEALQTAAIKAAKEARDFCAIEDVKIAGCLPPLIASYRPDVAPDFETSVTIYRQIVAQQADYVDVILCETMASVSEARAAATAGKESGKPVWVALTVNDDDSGALRSGEPLSAALAALDEIGVDAKLLNCSKPEAISFCWHTFSMSSGPLGAYANGFTSIESLQPGGTVKSLEARHDLDPDQYAEFALAWVVNGATIVGGCCEVGPEHIARLAESLRRKGYEITNEISRA